MPVDVDEIKEIFVGELDRYQSRRFEEIFETPQKQSVGRFGGFGGGVDDGIARGCDGLEDSILKIPLHVEVR